MFDYTFEEVFNVFDMRPRSVDFRSSVAVSDAGTTL